ncbi:hypothetical protein BGX28_005905 [Mortierella sp. GBA30]|nr:hypothetical protein BGX28_005905 [Mortierella sp. GBA30]
MDYKLCQQHPLNVPEIRSRIARLLSARDAASCAKVSKAWSRDFIPFAWRTVDFEVNTDFETLDAQAIRNYGRHIRSVKNLRTLQQLKTLLQPSVVNLQELSIDNTPMCGQFCTLSADLVSNNSRSLTKITWEVFDEPIEHNLCSQMIPVHALLPPSSSSKLTFLRLSGVRLSRNSFVSLLRRCPSLKEVELPCYALLFEGAYIDNFQHTGVTKLYAPIDQVFQPDPKSPPLPTGLSLLYHFPNITTWELFLVQALVVPLERIKSELSICCPHITAVDVRDTPSLHASNLLAKVFSRLEKIHFLYKTISQDVIVSALIHQVTLTCISSRFDGDYFLEKDDSENERDKVCPVHDEFRNSGRIIQLIPRTCPNLLQLKLWCHEMDMDYVEESKWACKRLRCLCVRIRGLDTSAKIKQALDMWIRGRQKPNRKTTLYANRR